VRQKRSLANPTIPIDQPHRVGIVSRRSSIRIEGASSLTQRRRPVSRSGTASSRVALATLIITGAAILGLLLFAQPTTAQQRSQAVYAPGDAIVTGFAGIKPATTPAGGNPLDTFVIDLDGSVMKVFEIGSPGSAPRGQLINALPHFKIPARAVGQVFAISLDDDGKNQMQPNIYLGATSAYGLNIVVPGPLGPKRVIRGTTGAVWMEGQFGTAQGGTPGSIWRVDGATGQVSLFATIPNNSGPGIGDIAHDKSAHQFFASDLDTGLIHRIGSNGTVIDSFDHGTMARAMAGLTPIPDDGKAAVITSPAFDSENPATWGMTQPIRRVWGLAVNNGRLYYAVWSGPQVWSVGISANGFANDARLEFDLGQNAPATSTVTPQDRMPIAHMVFDTSGTLYLAQRGGIGGRYDYSVFADAGRSEAMRLRPQGGWTLEHYAIGLAPQQKFASGGVALGYGYSVNGQADGHCDATLWVTGDQLRNDPDPAKNLQAGGPLVVHGLQGNSTGLVQPENASQHAYFVDYDGAYGDPEAEGHVGSVAIYQPCNGVTQSRQPASPGQQNVPGGQPNMGGQPGRPGTTHTPPNTRNTPNLAISKTFQICNASTAGGYDCSYTVSITNTGTSFQGNISFQDTVPANATLITTNAGAFVCTGSTPTYTCNATNVSLAPSATLLATMDVIVPQGAVKGLNCQVVNKVHLAMPATGVGVADASSTGTINDPSCSNTGGGNNANLAISKTSQGCQTDNNGGYDCTYNVTLSNSGSGIYTGPITFTDTLPNGTTFTSFTSLGGLGGFSTVCTSGGGQNYNCTANVIFQPGSSHSMLIVVKLAKAAVPGHCTLTNTVKLTAPSTNVSKATDSVTDTITDPNCNQANLAIAKAFRVCSQVGPGLNCIFDVTVTNSGASAFQGVVSFTDTLPTQASLSNTTASGFGSCAGNNGAYTCSTGNAITLSPGQSIATTVTASVPMRAALGMNCRMVNQVHLAAPAANAGTKDASATAIFLTPQCGALNFPKLDITKTLDHCAPADNGGYFCVFKVQVTNHGTQFNGIVIFNDISPNGTTQTHTTADFNVCTGSSNGAYQCTTGNPVSLAPNQSLGTDITVSISKDVVGTLNNCRIANTVNIVEPATNTGTGSASAAGSIDDPGCKSGLVITKQVSGTCISDNAGGYSCGFDVLIRSANANNPFTGDITYTDTIPNGTTLDSNNLDDFNICTPNGQIYTCTTKSPITLDKNKPATGTHVIVRVPKAAVTANCQLINTVHLNTPTNRTVSKADAAATSSLPDPACTQPVPNLTISKTSQGCVKTSSGFDCSYLVQVTNTGASFYGDVSFTDTLSGFGTLTNSQTGGFAACFYSGAGLDYTCTTPAPVTLGQNQSISTVIALHLTLDDAQRSYKCTVPNKVHLALPTNNVGQADASATTTITDTSCTNPGNPDLSIAKRAVQCVVNLSSNECTFNVFVTNNSITAPFSGVISFTDTVPPNTTLKNVTGAFGPCAGGPPVYTCTTPQPITLAPGATISTQVTIVLPPSVAQGLKCKVPNQVHLVQPTANVSKADDSATGQVDPSICAQLNSLPISPPRCPPGYHLQGGQCYGNEPPPAGCPVGMLMSGDHCCPYGTAWSDGQCRPPVGRTCPNGGVYPNCCPRGLLYRDGLCIQDCGRNQHLSNGHCCPSGAEWTDGQCRPVTSRTCPSGGVYPNCCSRGQFYRDGKCVTLSNCPNGQEWNGRQCVSPERKCRPGMVGTPPNCHVNEQPCGRGMVRKNGVCVGSPDSRPQLNRWVPMRRPFPRPLAGFRRY
jgi:uncharacterized repeat protein (TIGR01451 family)